MQGIHFDLQNIKNPMYNIKNALLIAERNLQETNSYIV